MPFIPRTSEERERRSASVAAWVEGARDTIVFTTISISIVGGIVVLLAVLHWAARELGWL